MRSPGLPTYTQATLAWPDLPLRDRVTEEVLVSFGAKGGGTHGEFTFVWINLRGGLPAMQLRVFQDGIAQLLDERIVRVCKELRRLGPNNDPSPEKLIELLEAERIGPSQYHLRGMLLHGRDLTAEEKDKLQKRLATLNRREGE